MQRVHNPTAAVALPAYPATGAPGYFDDTPGARTIIDAAWLNMLQEELANLLEAAGGTPSSTDDEQLADLLGGLVCGALAAAACTTGVTTAALCATNVSLSGATRGLVAASEDASVNDSVNAAALACDSGGVLNGSVQAAVVASASSYVDSGYATAGEEDANALIGASWGSSVLAGKSGGTYYGAWCAAMMGCETSVLALGKRSVLLASKNAVCIQDNVVAGGYDGTTTPTYDPDTPADANLTWVIHSDTGNINIDGSVATPAADYAEWFPNERPGALPAGLVVSHRAGRVRPAQTGDRVLGVVSAQPGVIGNAPGPNDKPRDPAQYTLVALLGQVVVRTDHSIDEDSDGALYAGADGLARGFGAGLPRMELLELLEPYAVARGYGLAMVLVR